MKLFGRSVVLLITRVHVPRSHTRKVDDGLGGVPCRRICGESGAREGEGEEERCKKERRIATQSWERPPLVVRRPKTGPPKLGSLALTGI